MTIDFFLNPNMAYLLLVAGVMLVMFAVIVPGTGVLELAAVFTLILAGWEVYYLPINLWAVAVLVLGVAPFIFAVKRSRQPLYLLVAILAFAIGSSFMFRGPTWYQPAVNPILAIVVSVITGLYLWLSIRKVLEAESAIPTHDLSQLIGEVGEAKTDVLDEGSVQIGSELWSARSVRSIPAYSKVRVVGREGLVLIVESEPTPGQALSPS